MTSREDIVALLKQAIDEITLGERPIATISESDALLEGLELDSLDYASVVLAAEEQLGISISEDGVDWTALDTVGALADFLHGEAASAG